MECLVLSIVSRKRGLLSIAYEDLPLGDRLTISFVKLGNGRTFKRLK